MRIAGALWSMSLIAVVKASQNFSADPESTAVMDEENKRLVSIFSKNKYGYNTRFMSDFELLLESLLNEQFLDNATTYYSDEETNREVEDQEDGLAGDFSHADVANLIHDQSTDSHENYKALQYPDRVGTNYPKGDELSCYKILPKQ
jgi:hypothetical protein